MTSIPELSSSEVTLSSHLRLQRARTIRRESMVHKESARRASVIRSSGVGTSETSYFARPSTIAGSVHASLHERRPSGFVRENSQQLKRWSDTRRSTFRLRYFAHIVKLTQHPIPVAIIYLLCLVTLITPIAFFLHYASAPMNDDGSLDTKMTINVAVNFGLCIFYGSRNFLLLVLGLGAVQDNLIISTLILDVLVWSGTCICWGLALQVDEWTDDNIFILSLAGLLNALQFSTFTLLNTVLNPLVKSRKRGRMDFGGVVSVDVVMKLIDHAGIPEDYKVVLKEEVKTVDLNQDGQLDQVQFFAFSNKVMAWIDRWSERGHRKELNELRGKLQFSTLDQETATSYFTVDSQERDSTTENESNLDDDVDGLNGSIISCLLISAKHLVTGQKLRATAMLCSFILMAFSQFGVFFIVGEAVDIAGDLARGDDSRRPEFNRFILYLCLVQLLNTSMYYITSGLGSSLISRAQGRIQHEITQRVLHGGPDFEKRFSRGALLNAFCGHLSRSESVWNQLWYRLVFPLATLAAATVFFCIVNLAFAMFALVAVPVVFCCKNLMEGSATYASERYTNSSSFLLGRFQNILGISKAAKVYGNQGFLIDRLDESIEMTKSHNFLSLLWGNLFGAVFNTVGTTLLLVSNVVLLLALATGRIEAGEFFSLNSFVTGIIKPLENLGLLSGRVSYLSGAVYDLERVLEYKEPVQEEDAAGDLDGSPTPYKPKDEEALVLDGVSFRYGPDLPLILHDVTASIKVGTYNCIFGPSGSGKSTILSIVEGCHRASGGRVYVYGVDVSSMPSKELRKKLGVVFQETYVLDGTIRENIAFGYEENSQNEMSLNAVIEAAKKAQIHNFIQTLPEQYETMIGLEADIALSGGQLQRICGLARALARRPALLVLDEATSALDTVSEQVVIDTVAHLAKSQGMTVLSASHHTSTAVQADNILVLSKHGTVEQSGTYNELMGASGGLFADLVEAGNHGSSIPVFGDSLNVSSTVL